MVIIGTINTTFFETSRAKEQQWVIQSLPLSGKPIYIYGSI